MISRGYFLDLPTKGRCVGLWLTMALCAPALRAMPPLDIPPGGEELLPEHALGRASYGTKVGGTGKWTDLPDAPGGKAWRVDVPKGAPTAWQAQISLEVPGTAKSGDVMLLAFYARGEPGNGVNEPATGNLSIEVKDPPNYLKLGVGGYKVGRDWTPVYIPFQAGVSAVEGKTFVNWQLAVQAQRLDITGARLINYRQSKELKDLPRPYVHYPGRESDAAWRKAALERIEKDRVREFTIKVNGADGQPAAGAKVDARLARHDFNFGAAVKAHFLMGDDVRSPKYREMVDRNFSCIVFENDLKPFAWPLSFGNQHRHYRQDWLRKSIDWCKDRGIRMRGHYMMIGVWEDWTEKLREQPELIREGVRTHIRSLAETVGKDIFEWDVLNHPVGWIFPRKTVDQAVGASFYADMVKEARALVKTPLYVNEDQVFRPGHQQEAYVEVIKDLIAQGAAPDGIGNQAHFHSSFLPAPEDMLRVSDRLAALVPRLNITEFDVLTNGDEALQADWLRDCLIMAYSHPAYTGFILWVFWEGTGYKPEAALWRKDWSERPNATVWREWVCEKWRTDITDQTGPDGTLRLRGHAGLYDIRVEKDGKTVERRASLIKPGDSTELSLPRP